MADSNVDKVAKYAYSESNKQQIKRKPFNKKLDAMCKTVKTAADKDKVKNDKA